MDGMTKWQRWLSRAKVTDDPAGDFVTDMRDDRQAPKTFASLGDLRAYLRSRRACDGALGAASDAWLRFTTWKKRRAA
jgi:YozE SAM-like protein